MLQHAAPDRPRLTRVQAIVWAVAQYGLGARPSSSRALRGSPKRGRNDPNRAPAPGDRRWVFGQLVDQLGEIEDRGFDPEARL
jgi:hypothetical protein